MTKNEAHTWFKILTVGDSFINSMGNYTIIRNIVRNGTNGSLELESSQGTQWTVTAKEFIHRLYCGSYAQLTTKMPYLSKTSTGPNGEIELPITETCTLKLKTDEKSNVFKEKSRRDKSISNLLSGRKRSITAASGFVGNTPMYCRKGGTINSGKISQGIYPYLIS